MNKINVSELTETELSRLMTWFYCGATVIKDTGKSVEIMYVLKNGEYHQGAISYLTDYNLTMPLAVENDLWTESLSNNRLKGTAGTMVGSTTAQCSTLLRAICEVLVMIKLEEMGL